MLKTMTKFSFYCFIALILVACSDDDNNAEEDQDNIDENENGSESIADDEDNNNDRNDHDGKVVFNGEATYEDHLLTVEGDTNLPEEASVFISPNPLDSSSFINVSGSTDVESDGSFQFETHIPDEYDYGLDVKVRFRPEDQSDDAVQEIYGATGEQLEGPFVRLYESSDEIMQQASTSVYLPLGGNDSAQKDISEPDWQEPGDYGDETIRLEPDVEVEEDFIMVEGESNLIEGSRLSLSLLNEDGARTDGSSKVRTAPDGSFRGWIENPGEDEELEDYDVRIVFEPSKYSWENVSDHYGEEGEHISGELVEDQEAIIEVPVD